MKRALLSLLLLPALLLSGCASQDPAEPTPTPPVAAPSPSVVELPAAGRPLTGEEIARVNEAFLSHTERDGVTYATPVSGFFTSYYDDVTQLDFFDFLYYFPGNGTLGEEDQAEYAALAALPDFPYRDEVDTLGWDSPEDLPVPTHRIPRASVDEALERYAGITAADLADTSGVPYSEEYDAWYTFSSDFGPGTFVCAGGQVDEEAGAALLWTDTRGDGTRVELLLGRDGENWHIRAHRNTADDLLLELLAGLEGTDIGSVSWYGSNQEPDAGMLATLLREGAERSVPAPTDAPYATTVWSLDCYLAPAGQDTYSGDDALHLTAGLAENVVEVFSGGSLPGGRVWLESEELYQLLRTSNDPPADLLPAPSAYAPYQEAIAAHLDGVCARAWEGRYTGWDIVEFAREDGWTGFSDGTTLEVWFVRSAFRAEPAEEALQMLAGGMYVDSQLRAYGLDSAPLLLVAVPAGGEPFPLAFVPWDWWEGLSLAGADSLDEALPLIAQAGELTAQGAEL